MQSLKSSFGRCFVIIFLLMSVFRSAVSQSTIDPGHYVPLQKNLSEKWKESLWHDERKTYKGKELLTIGMPCGGIAAGQLYVRGDGTFANWWTANNAYNTGYGIDYLMNFNTALGPWKVCYQTFKPISYIDQGFSITVLEKGKDAITRSLNEKDFDDISFIGEYPIAYINYSSVKNPLPVEINAEVFSPFIPLNAKESATPGTILRYHLKNNSRKPVSVSLTGWLQNLVCLEIKNEINAKSRNAVRNNNSFVSVVMDLVKGPEAPATEKPVVEVFDDFEEGSFRKWNVVGTAFGKGPADKPQGDQQPVSGYQGNFYVNSFHDGDRSTGKMTSGSFTVRYDYVRFMIGGGTQKGRTCINLLVDGKVVRTETGSSNEKLEPKSWDVAEFKGKQAFFQIVDSASRGWGHINVDNLTFSNSPLIKEKYFPEMHPYFGNIALSVLSENGFGDADISDSDKSTMSAEKLTGEKLVGSAGASIDLKPGETKDIVFLLTWYFPNRPAFYGDGGNWNKAIPTDGVALVGNMYSNWYNSSSDVAQWLSANLDRLSSETHNFHESYYGNTTLPYWLKQRLMMPVSTLATETCQWWATDKFWAWEGVGSCVGTCTHVWNYEHALARLFPELERNIREKTDFGTSFREDGAVYARNGWGGILIDGHAGAILKAYREHLNSKDKIFLSRNWEKIKKAAEYLIKEDENNDGLIEKTQSNTYDIAFYGANTYVGGLYLASLKAASRMAVIMNDTSFSSRCNRIYESGVDLTVKKLWNGEYFIQDVDLAKHPRFQYAGGCLSDQLLGQTWANLNNLGYIYPVKNVRTALESIWKYNWTPDVALQNKNHPPERVYANPGEAGLFVCTWPMSKHLGENGVRYRDEVWTGIEYQVATSMVYEGMIEEALSIVKAVHDRYSPEKHNPWNEIECGDHYARALASWGVYIALEDYFYDGPQKSLKFAPKINQNNFNGFFTAAEGWGNLKQTRNQSGQSNVVSVSFGKVQLKSLSVELAENSSNIKVFFGNIEIPASPTFRNGMLTVEFNDVTVTADKPLKLMIGKSI